MELSTSPVSPARLQKVKASPDRIVYVEQATVGGKRLLSASIFGLAGTSEIFVELTDRTTVLASSFHSRHRDYPIERRRLELPLVDMADAFEVARRITRNFHPSRRNRLHHDAPHAPPLPPESA